MQNVKRYPFAALAIAALVLCLCFGLVACAPQATEQSSSPSSGSSSAATTGVAGEYVSDEQCLSCHGGTYDALAETTAGLGDWNPHDPIHGGYNSCQNCHAKDKEITDNYCEHCHSYAPSQEAAA
ncbi:cytochrome c3 family protein [Raoultibacter massiliensis]|uniref:cytochrome c3 family protein n=1 Tax=Raoultibacter massiliensis TaxID=1852371 RepID=UPI000C82A979|nr:cytochrome c3 family protein [Raoultibacter massiliensis]